MISFNPIAADVIRDYAANLKVDIGTIDTDHLTLDCQDFGLVSFFAADNNRDLILGLERKTSDFHDTNLWLRWLKMAGFDADLRAYINVGLTKDAELILFVRYNMQEFTYQQLQLTLDRIAHLHERYVYDLGAQ